MRTLARLLLAGYLVAMAAAVRADEFCLLLAETYYEQLYCELQALGQGRGLPSLLDFRRNDDLTQALVLKRPAARAGIEVAVPKPKPKLSPQAPKVPVASTSPSAATTAKRDEPACQLEGKVLRCSDSRYRLVGNRGNGQLAEGVLDSDNPMDIPPVPSDREGLDAYLSAAYRQYLAKMMEIGLGGSTFSYRKFVYLFEDISGRGLDFSGRFEMLFGFLKQDKRRLSVDERLPDISQLSPASCEPLDRTLAVCDGGRKNYLFRAD